MNELLDTPVDLINQGEVGFTPIYLVPEIQYKPQK
jgi:hypothetical protein